MLLTDNGTRGLRLARKHIAAYCDYLPDSDSLREVATQSEETQPVFTALENISKAPQPMLHNMPPKIEVKGRFDAYQHDQSPYNSRTSPSISSG